MAEPKIDLRERTKGFALRVVRMPDRHGNTAP
jgi:hypothetical protein